MGPLGRGEGSDARRSPFRRRAGPARRDHGIAGKRQNGRESLVRSGRGGGGVRSLLPRRSPHPGRVGPGPTSKPSCETRRCRGSSSPPGSGGSSGSRGRRRPPSGCRRPGPRCQRPDGIRTSGPTRTSGPPRRSQTAWRRANCGTTSPNGSPHSPRSPGRRTRPSPGDAAEAWAVPNAVKTQPEDVDGPPRAEVGPFAKEEATTSCRGTGPSFPSS